MKVAEILSVLNANKHRFDAVDWCGGTPRELEWREENLMVFLSAKNPLSGTWSQAYGQVFTLKEAGAIALTYANETGIDYDMATLAKYSEARKILIAAEELEGLADGMNLAIRQGNEEVAIQLAKRAANKALTLIECRKAIEKVFSNSSRFRWIKLSEAKPEEMPVDGERIEVLTEDTQSRQDGWYTPSIAMYRFENNQHSFYPMFTWSVLEMVLENPEQAKKIYADKVYLSVKNVIYFRHINREDLPEYIPRERRKVDF